MPALSTAPRGILDPLAAGANLAFGWFAPADDLAHVIDRHWAVRWDRRALAAFVQEVLPHPGANLCFEPSGASVHGLLSRRARHTLTGAGLTVGTMFRPAGFARLSALPMTSLTDRGVPLPEALGPDGASLELEVERAGDVEAMIVAVERFLRARLPAPDPAADLVDHVVAAMLDVPAGTRVRDVASIHDVSPRALQRLFRRYLGVGPKWVLQRYRLHEAAERIAAGNCRWSDVAFDLGYADQAHFIRDFRVFVGHTPGAYAAACAAS